jgi:hypothetical protein
LLLFLATWQLNLLGILKRVRRRIAGFLLYLEDLIMTRWIGTLLIAIGALSVSLADATESQARGRRGCGSNGGGGSWGNGGSRGGGGSFGGLFSRSRNGSHGGWGSNGGCGSHGGWGSNGGRFHSNGCGSHGGAYHGEAVEVHSGYRGDGEVRYYGERVESTAPMAAPAPVMENEVQDRGMQQNSSRIDAPAPPPSQESDFNQPSDIGAPAGPQDSANPPAPPAGGNQSVPPPSNSPQEGAGAPGEPRST